MRKPIHDYMEFTDLKDMLNKTGKIYGDRPAYVFKTEEKGKFREITHKEFRDDINSLGTALIELGLKGKRVAVISDNRYEWGLVYLAVATGVGVIVPLDKALPDNEIESLMMRSEIEAIVYSKKYDEVMNRVREEKNTNVKYFISMDIEKNEKEVYSLKQLLEKGKKKIEDGDREFLDAKINAEEMGIMLFTSGTTARSKAVMLSHKNICANLMDIASVIKLKENDRMLSFLPLHHTFECTVGFLYPISKGCSIAFCEGIRHIADNVKEFQVTAMISVPILYETIYKKIMKGIEKKGKLETVKKGIKISNFLLKFGIDIRRIIFKEVHENLGGKARLFVAGGAALDPEAERGFNNFGIKMLQGYGLTESSPVIAAEDDKYQRLGSIGKAFPSIDVKIENPNEEGVGELLAKGPSIMLGYYNNEEATKETLEDGWLHTGDLAKIDKDGYIFISGRKKFVIVLKNGKNIYPEELETLVNKIEGIKESFVYGKPEDDGDYKICCKIVYDKDNVKEIYGTDEEEKLKFENKHPELQEVMQIVNWIDGRNLSPNLVNARAIKIWMQTHKTTKSPSAVSKDAEENRLGTALTELRRNLIKPYMQLETEEEKLEFSEKHPEIDEVLQIINWIDTNKVNPNLTNVRNIKAWMEERKTTKPPSSNSKDKEEKRLGRALGNIKQTLVKTYMQLGTQEKEEFEQEHPEFREIMEIINWIDENNISPYLINARDIKQWVEQNQFAKLPSRSSKAVEEERKLGKKLSYIRQDLIGTYMKLQTEQEREIFREKHPEIDKVMSIISELDIQCGNAKQKELAILIRQDLEKRKALQEAKKLEKDYKEQLAIRKANVIETQEQGVDINE